MKISVSKSDLESALKIAQIGIAGSGMDLSSHFLFRKKGDGVEIRSFNQRICATVPLQCEYDGEEGDAFTVEGWRLVTWLSAVGDVTIEIEQVSDSEIRVSNPKAHVHLASLDPAKFPSWDKTLADSKIVATVPSERLLSAFSYAKEFISDNDTTRPEISQIEFMKGSVWATDRMAVTLITLEGVEDSSLRIHGKDIPSVNKFLGAKGTEEVEILEHERMTFFRRADGATLGASRPIAQFPSLNLSKDGDDAIQWTIRTKELLQGIKQLSASAEKENKKLRFSFKDGQVLIGVTSTTGKEETFPLECIEQLNSEDLPEEGFWLNYRYIEHIVDHFGGDTIKFGINQRGKGGFVRFLHSVGGDEYLTVVVWLI